MLVATLALTVVSALSLAFSETRLLGLLGVAILLYMHPLFVIALAIAAVFAVALVAALTKRHQQKGVRRALPNPHA